MLSSEGVIISNNYCENTRKPFVVDGKGAKIISNTCIATGTADLYHETGLSLRDVSGAVVRNNRLEGVGAYIDVVSLSGDDLVDCEISDNQLISTLESSELSASIRISSSTSLCLRNRVFGNSIKNVSIASASQGVITVAGSAGFRASGNVIDSNMVIIEAGATGVYNNYADATVHRRNIYDRSGYDAGAPETTTFSFFNNSDNILTEFNEYRYSSGGVNVTSNAVNVNVSSNFPVIRGERNAMTSGALVAASLINAAGTGGVKIRNHYDLDQPLVGVVTFPSGTGTVTVNNNNVKSGSRIWISPANAGAAEQQSSDVNDGVYASEEFASARFRLITGAGSATASSGDWFWEIDG
jgi:hypothetical protein